MLNDLKSDKINPKLFYFAGGEPLINDYHWHIIDFLIERKRFDINIFYNTNLSVLKYKGNDFVEKLKKFENVSISASCDSLYKKGEYIRYGFKHEIFINNINELKKNNFKYSITTVISHLNIIYLNDFLNDLIDNELNQDVIFIIAFVENFFNMPENFLNRSIIELDKILVNPRVNDNNKMFFKNIKKEFLKKRIFNYKIFKTVFLNLIKYDHIFNKLNFKDSLPELYDLVKEYVL